MNFQRKRIKGQTAKDRETYIDTDTGCYRIEKVRTIKGVKMEFPFWHASVRTEWGWGFAGRRGPHKTRKAAEKACEDNVKAWTKFMAVKGRTKVTDVRRLKANLVVGKGKYAVPILSDIPTWVQDACDPRLLEILYPTTMKKLSDEEEYECECESPNDLTQTSTSSDDNTGSIDEPQDGLASSVEVSERSTNSTNTEESTSAPPVKAKAKRPVKKSSKRTAKTSKRGGKKRKQ
jgi:Mg-chelatase subunit ChlI